MRSKHMIKRISSTVEYICPELPNVVLREWLWNGSERIIRCQKCGKPILEVFMVGSKRTLDDVRVRLLEADTECSRG